MNHSSRINCTYVILNFHKSKHGIMNFIGQTRGIVKAYKIHIKILGISLLFSFMRQIEKKKLIRQIYSYVFVNYSPSNKSLINIQQKADTKISN